MNFSKSKNYLMVALALAVGFTACKKDKNSGPFVKGDGVLSGVISTKRVLSKDTVYTLKGYVRVMNGGSLEIPAGTVLKGEKASKAALIIERTGTIKANGTASNPIIFTSDRPVGERNTGDWSGVIICGKSTVNTADGTAQYESGVLGADVAIYGGTEPTHSSGTLTYVRIEFAGVPIQTDKEINGLTLCGVGSGTVVNHIQVSYSGDDSFEFFGGTVNATHLVAYRGVDDDFDMDQSFNGKLQYGISIKDPNVYDAAGTSRGIELENKGTVTGEKYTKPVISNFTFIGPGVGGNEKHGALIHFGLSSRMVLANSIIVGAKGAAVEFNSNFTAQELKDGRSILSDNLIFGGSASYGLSTGITAFTDLTALTTFAATAGNAVLTSVDAAGLNSTNIDAPNLTLKSTSVANGKAKYAGDLNTGFTKETFVGAMGTTDWTTGWANWTPKVTVY